MASTSTTPDSSRVASSSNNHTRWISLIEPERGLGNQRPLSACSSTLPDRPPLAAVLSSALLLDHLELVNGANAVRKAVAEVLRTGQAKTKDVGGSATTAQVGEALLKAV